VWLSCAASPAQGGKFDAKVVILGAYVVARVLGTLGGTGELTHGVRENDMSLATKPQRRVSSEVWVAAAM
jgi:hypothetical protein